MSSIQINKVSSKRLAIFTQTRTITIRLIRVEIALNFGRCVLSVARRRLTYILGIPENVFHPSEHESRSCNVT